MGTRTRSRDDLRWLRRTQHYQDKLAAAGPSTLARVGVASDWFRALLVEAPTDVGTDIGEQIVRSLLSAVARVEKLQKGGRP